LKKQAGETRYFIKDGGTTQKKKGKDEKNSLPYRGRKKMGSNQDKTPRKGGEIPFIKDEASTVAKRERDTSASNGKEKKGESRMLKEKMGLRT